MKKSGSCLKVYLALFLLIVLVAVFPYREGFDNSGWLDLSSWFAKKDEKKEEKKEQDSKSEKKYDDNYESSLLGATYTTKETTNDVSYNNFNM
jgi:hypothetical protein